MFNYVDMFEGGMAGYTANMNDDDNFSDNPDTDRTGLDNNIDDMQDHDPFEPDSDFIDPDETDDVDDPDPGIDNDEDTINEPDLDHSPSESEPDWDVFDKDESDSQAEVSKEDDSDSDTDTDDTSIDSEDEIDPSDEIIENIEGELEDEIEQNEETGYDLPLYPDITTLEDEETDFNLADEIEETLEIPESEIDFDTSFLSDWLDQELEKSVEFFNLEPFTDYTQYETTSDLDEEGINVLIDILDEIGAGYNPNESQDSNPGTIEIGNILDDTFADLFESSMGDEFFAWYDSLDIP